MLNKPVCITLLTLVLTAPLGWTQTPPVSPGEPTTPGGPQSPSNPEMTSTIPSGTGTQTISGGYLGTWVATRAIYDFITTLKDVGDAEGSYYHRLILGAQGKGKLWYNGKQDPIDIEYEMKDQGLTIAYGSRLKPQTDLFQLIMLSDGTLFLKSRRLGTMNGTMYYFLARE